MRAKATAMLCEASFIAGAVLTPPIWRKTKHGAGLLARRSARGYVQLKGRARHFGEATGRPGQLTAFAAVFAAQTARDAANRWWKMVEEAERGEQVEKAATPALAEPPTTIRDYVGEDYVQSPS